MVSAQSSAQLTRKTETSGHTWGYSACVCVCVCVCVCGGFRGDLYPHLVSMVPPEDKFN